MPYCLPDHVLFPSLSTSPVQRATVIDIIRLDRRLSSSVEPHDPSMTNRICPPAPRPTDFNSTSPPLSESRRVKDDRLYEHKRYGGLPLLAVRRLPLGPRAGRPQDLQAARQHAANGTVFTRRGTIVPTHIVRVESTQGCFQ